MNEVRFSKKMTKEEWQSISAIAQKDPARMALFDELLKLNEVFRTGEPSFRGVDRWHDLHLKLLEREWQILVESRRIERGR